MRRVAWQERFWTVLGFFVPAFVGTLGVLAACWLLVAIVLGSVELARRLW